MLHRPTPPCTLLSRVTCTLFPMSRHTALQALQTTIRIGRRLFFSGRSNISAYLPGREHRGELRAYRRVLRRAHRVDAQRPPAGGAHGAGVTATPPTLHRRYCSCPCCCSRCVLPLSLFFRTWRAPPTGPCQNSPSIGAHPQALPPTRPHPSTPALSARAPVPDVACVRAGCKPFCR